MVIYVRCDATNFTKKEKKMKKRAFGKMLNFVRLGRLRTDFAGCVLSYDSRLEFILSFEENHSNIPSFMAFYSLFFMTSSLYVLLMS